jgi:hypothetical protein
MQRYLKSMKIVLTGAGMVVAILLVLLKTRGQNKPGPPFSAIEPRSAASRPGDKIPPTANEIPCIASVQQAVPAKSQTMTATPVKPHYVDLSWKPSSTPGVVKYNVHRCTPGSPCLANTSVIASVTGISYTDSQVQSSHEYCYFVNAVANVGRPDSGPSNIVHVVIPSP